MSQLTLCAAIDVAEIHRASIHHCRRYRAVYPNVSNGAVSIANRLILWDFDIRQLHSE
jgi:hypothetical protein